MIPLYENSGIRDVTGETIRPGGFALTDRAVAFCSLPEGGRVLDVGCGTGATVAHLRREYGLDASGLDFSDQLLSEGRERDSGVDLVRAAASSLPVGDERMAAVFCECVLSLTDHSPVVLGEFRRVLRPNGFLILSDLYVRSPDGSVDLACLPVRSCLSGAMAQSEIEARIKKSGFRILLWEDHSRFLAELAARYILARGSLQGLWGGPCENRDSPSIASAVRRSRPGYYLLIAEKEA